MIRQTIFAWRYYLGARVKIARLIVSYIISREIYNTRFNQRAAQLSLEMLLVSWGQWSYITLMPLVFISLGNINDRRDMCDLTRIHWYLFALCGDFFELDCERRIGFKIPSSISGMSFYISITRSSNLHELKHSSLCLTSAPIVFLVVSVTS